MRKLVQSRRTEALLHAHDVLVRFGGRTGTVLPNDADEVVAYAAQKETPGQNMYTALFYDCERTRRLVLDALRLELGDLVESNSGPLTIFNPRLQRVMEARIEWSKT